ncbi:MAG: hypothetical protein M1528_03260 [Candidatus Marsarchaeota archaeon]|jgi:hypothetical protein|nr:hypothetical protein [Candidatus Marsarchaeota archaeon]MCL5115525.1 hypothetical protein [Candidatus Marsarchaeota archaeon]
MDNKTIAVYLIITLIVVAAVAAVLINSARSASYNVKVTLLTNSTGTMYPYQESGFRIYVNNTGGSEISGLPLLLYLNGNPFESYKMTLPGRVGTYITANYIYPSNGTYQFRAIADPGDVFQIANRQAAQSSITINVSNPQQANPYTSIPNANITETQTTYLLNGGITLTQELAQGYNITLINNMVGPSGKIMAKVFEDLASTINDASISQARYSHNASAYSIWLQGTLNPSQISIIAGSFSVPQQTASINGVTGAYAKISNSTSMCFYYSGGWTKIVSYYNGSAPSTCKSISNATYNNTISPTISNVINSTPRIRGIFNNFTYINASYMGQSLSYSPGGNVGIAKMFSNIYGYYMAYVQRNNPEVNISARIPTCYGLIYNSSNTSICSSYVSPTGSSGTDLGLINETIITNNYTASLYSFINQSNLEIANENGLALLESLKLSNSSMKWSPAFKNTCSLPNSTTALSCSVLSFDHTSSAASLAITNNMPSQAKLNSISCVFQGMTGEQILNSTLKPGETVNITTTCYNLPVPIVAASTTYTLAINYTVNGNTRIDNGTLNISNLAV